MRGDPDKTRVLDVKPLRTLKPIFPAYSGSSPPILPLNGPHPPGFSPAYPVVVPQGGQAAVAPTPLRAYRDPSESDGVVDGLEDTVLSGAASQKKARRSKDSNFWVPITNDYVVPLDSSQRDDGDEELVGFVLMTFDGLKRKLSQLDDARERSVGMIKRADLKVGNIMMSKGFRTNMRRRIGAPPGVKVGDIFFFRMELCMVGLHAHSMGGIDYANIGDGPVDQAVALSIVSSGMYDDDAGDSNVLIYSGQGGGTTSKDKQTSDQKLVRGNLALDRSLRRANEIRIIRGMKDPFAANSKVYLYDGLYNIQESWTEKGKAGANTFKYKLIRIQGQSGAFAVWKTIERWKELVSARPGLIVTDLTGGAESSGVPLVNEVDNEKGPGYFNYFYTLRYFRAYSLVEISHGCDCHECKPDNPNCSCIQANEGLFPYTGNGILVGRRPVLHECGPSCLCYPNCKNRVSQTGLKVRLEVFKTKDRGWGLRSWDPLRAGTFICEYAGEVIDKAKLVQQLDGGEVNDYIFDTSRMYDAFKWNHESNLLEESSLDDSEEFNLPSPLIITAKNMGNIARFMNHSCNPNVFWQSVIHQNKNEAFLHIAFFAKKHIPPLTELTYDYGVLPSDGVDSGAQYRQRSCLCGYGKCRGYFSASKEKTFFNWVRNGEGVRASVHRLAVGWIDLKDKYCSRINCSGNHNPVWNTKFSALVDDSELLTLHVQVYSRDPFFFTERAQGFATVSLSEFLRKRNDGSGNGEGVGSYQLRKNDTRKPRGFVDVSVCVMSENGDERPFYPGGGGGGGEIMLLDHDDRITSSTKEDLAPALPNGPTALPLAAHKEPNRFQAEQPYTYPTPFPANCSNPGMGGPTYPSAAGPSCRPFQGHPPLPQPLQQTINHAQNYLTGVNYGTTRTYVNLPSSSTVAGQRGGFGIGLGAGALAVGGIRRDPSIHLS